MIIWRIHKLADQLRSGEFSARQVRPYLMAAVLWASAAFVFADWSRPWGRDDFETAVDSITTLINGVISAIGVYSCYRANGGASGSQLAERLTALGTALLVRFLVLVTLVLFVWIYISARLNAVSQFSFENFDLFSVLMVALYWVRLRHYVGTVAVTH